MSKPRVVSPLLASLFLLASLSPILGSQSVQATPVAVMHVSGTSAGFGQPGSADWDAYTVPNYQGLNGPFLWGTSPTTSAAEPSGGTCWATSAANPTGKDVFFFKNMVGEARATFNDATTPPTVTWNDVSHQVPPEGHWAFADPILHTDETTCRTWAGHMEFPSPCTTDIAFRDENPAALPPGNPVDGWTTTPLCQPSAADHETIGSGPYSKDLPAQLGTVYPHIVYYCAQYPDINGCTESYDGGLTWVVQEPGSDQTRLVAQCASIFGHLKVSPEGYAAIPHRACLNNAGIELSKNNGLTWSAIDVPGIAPNAHFDPSLAWSRNVQPGGNSWLYFGAGLSDGLHASVSKNFGATWTHTDRISDAYTGPHGEKITRAEFPNVEAGDWDRAAISFLGTTDHSSADAWSCTNDASVVWYMYVARTFDAGATWKVERASGDPVQVGGLWPNGGSETCRNLLDFNDLDLGSDGRLYVSFADGCLAPGCYDGASPATSTASQGTVIRQTTGCGLLAAHDASGADCVNGSGTVTTSGPQVTITSPADGATLAAGDLLVTGTVNRDAPGGGSGSGGSSHSLLPPLTTAGILEHPATAQGLYFHTAPLPVGNVDAAIGNGLAGPTITSDLPTGATASASVYTLNGGSTQSPYDATWTYHGPVALSNGDVTVSWYGLAVGTGTPERWEARVYVGDQISNRLGPHASATGTFPASTVPALRSLTVHNVVGEGQNMVVLITSTTLGNAADTAVVLYGSPQYPSGIQVVEGVVPNAPPTAAFSCTPSGLTLFCDASASSDDAGIVNYAWDFGDSTGAASSGPTVNHTYASGGTKLVTLTVSDGPGLTGTNSRGYSVSAPSLGERVELLVDDLLQGVANVNSATPGDHAWNRTLHLGGLAAGDHVLTARWLDADDTLLGTDQATLHFSSGGNGTGTSTSTSTSSSSSTSAGGNTDTGSAGGSVNNVAPVVDAVDVAPSVAVITRDGAVNVTGTAHDDNGNADVTGVTVKVTGPEGASSFLHTARANGTDATQLSFGAYTPVTADTPTGTYQVDTFATDEAGAQSPVVSRTFTVLPPPAVAIGYTGQASRLDFGSFDPGAHNVTSVNQITVGNRLHETKEFSMDMTDFACTRGAIPVMGNANVNLGHLDGNGTFVIDSIVPYSANSATVNLGTLSDGSEILVQFELLSVPKAIAGSCTASFGLYHT